MEIHEVIKEIRKNKRFSQKEMAEKLNMTPGGYFKVENGQSEITVSKLYRIAEIFNMKFEEILYYPNTVQNGSNEKVGELEKRVKELESRIEDKENLIYSYVNILGGNFSYHEIFSKEYLRILTTDNKYLLIKPKRTPLKSRIGCYRFITTKEQKRLYQELFEETSLTILNHVVVKHLRKIGFYKNKEEALTAITFPDSGALLYNIFGDDPILISRTIYRLIASEISTSLNDVLKASLRTNDSFLFHPDIIDTKKELIKRLVENAIGELSVGGDDYFTNDIQDLKIYSPFSHLDFFFRNVQEFKEELINIDIEFINEGYQELNTKMDDDESLPF